MINLIISIFIGAAAWVLSALFLFESNWTGIFFFFLFGVASLIFLNKRTAQKVMPIFMSAETMMKNVQSLPSEQARTNLFDKVVAEFKKAYKYKNYQFFLEAQLNAQIGSLYYIQQRFKDAEPYLAKSFVQNGPAICMYACILYRRGEKDAMAQQFEKALKFSPKQPLFWNLYAWCMLNLKDRTAAIAILNRCLQKNPGDKITRDNLDLVKNSGKIHMRQYNEQWFQFLLDDPREMQKRLMDKYSVVRSR